MTDPDPNLVNALAAIIRKVDGNHSLGAAALAEAILSDFSVIDVQIAAAMTEQRLPENYIDPSLSSRDQELLRIFYAASLSAEEVIRYLENDLKFVLWTDDLMDKFKKAMRSQQQENSNG